MHCFRASILCWLFFSFLDKAAHAGDVTIIDSRHYSNVFGEVRNFRIFLPSSYFENEQKRYPIIYFMHGWSQRYFGDGGEEYAGFDKGNQNKGDNIASFVSKNDVIVVKSDGYNRTPEEPYYKRPYNVSPVETFRQFPVYLPELIKYIDAHFRTAADREHRAISGLSMGGFMTYWIAAKYPQLFSAAGSFCGSPEFEVGPKLMSSEYRHIDMYKNFAGMNVWLHYGDKDFIRAYHEDMNKMWGQVMDNYQWKVYDAEHSTCGLGDMFTNFLKTFQNPPSKPATWDHIDVYPEFTVWDYQISTDRNVAGFTILENVDKTGFTSSVREYVPDGRLLSNVNVNIITGPVYEKNQAYIINDFDVRTSRYSQKTLHTDNEGKLMIRLNGSTHIIGINKKDDKPNIAVASYAFNNTNAAIIGKEAVATIKLVNKGLKTSKNVTGKLFAARDNFEVNTKQISFGNIGVNGAAESRVSFMINGLPDTFGLIKLKLELKDDSKNQWNYFLEVPIQKDVAAFKEFLIADGKKVTVANGGTDVTPVLLGAGNGDGIPNPGESIVVLVKDSGKYWRCDIAWSDKYINPGGESSRKSDNWTNFDHTGASAKYDVLLISSDCPQSHLLNLFAEYWVPQYPYHIVKQGKISLQVTGKDQTGPIISSVDVRGDNTIEVYAYDGGKIKSVKARLVLLDEPEKWFETDLIDEGSNGDRTGQDNLFSKTIPDRKFGLYRIIVDATDLSGNTTSREVNLPFALH